MFELYRLQEISYFKTKLYGLYHTFVDNFCTHSENQLLHNWGKLHYCGFVFLIAWTRNYLQYVIDDGKNITGKENNDNAH